VRPGLAGVPPLLSGRVAEFEALVTEQGLERVNQTASGCRLHETLRASPEASRTGRSGSSQAGRAKEVSGAAAYARPITLDCAFEVRSSGFGGFFRPHVRADGMQPEPTRVQSHARSASDADGGRVTRRMGEPLSVVHCVPVSTMRWHADPARAVDSGTAGVSICRHGRCTLRNLPRPRRDSRRGWQLKQVRDRVPMEVLGSPDPGADVSVSSRFSRRCGISGRRSAKRSGVLRVVKAQRHLGHRWCSGARVHTRWGITCGGCGTKTGEVDVLRRWR
jgi:hypothetical protein